jgi:hypothetical protein
MPYIQESLEPLKPPPRLRPNGRLAGNYMQAVTLGPWQETGGTTAGTLVPGEYLLGLMTVRPGLADLTDLYVRVTTGATTGTAFYVFYNVDTDGMPGTLAHATSAFTLSGGAGNKTVSAGSIETALSSREYYGGIYVPTGLTGAPVFMGARPAKTYVADIVNQARVALQYIEAVPGTSPASTLANVNFNVANSFNAPSTSVVPTLFGL